MLECAAIVTLILNSSQRFMNEKLLSGIGIDSTILKMELALVETTGEYIYIFLSLEYYGHPPQ